MLLCYRHQVRTVPPSLKPWRTWGWVENPAKQPKNYSFPQPEIPLSHQMYILPSSSNRKFHVITQHKLHLFCSGNQCCCITFLTQGFTYTYIMLILINQCLLNLVLCMTKALNGQSSERQNFHSPTFQGYLEKLASLKPYFSLSFPTIFYFKLYKVSPDSTTGVISWLVS